MEKKDIYTYISLLLLTAITAFFATNYPKIKWISLVILVLSAIKFLLVAFNFMELNKAHTFWKVLLVGYLVLFIIILSIVL